MLSRRALRLGIASTALVCVSIRLFAGDYVSPAQARLRADVAYLADDAREGRGPGTKGLDAAADYIATTFKEVGLKTAPGADGYFQHFELPGDRKLGEPKTLEVVAKKDKEEKLTARPGVDFTPLALGGPGEFKDLPVVFAGYGITAKDEERKLDYDDYDGIDVKGKAVLIIRRKPQQDKPEGPFQGKQNTTWATFSHKAGNASRHGAKAVLLVNDGFSLKDAKDELIGFSDAGGGASGDFGFFMVTREFADKILKAAGQPEIAELEKQIDSDLKPRSRALEGETLSAQVVVDRSPVKVKNVIGVLEGSGPLADETIVIGGHYDHVGNGGFGSLAPGNHSIHNGADDNASGTATVMEMARRLAARRDPLPRRVVFMAFSAEERGLIGSAYYANHPLFPLDKTVAMINFDMVGRLNDKSELTVFGSGTSPGWDVLVESLAKDQGLNAKNIVGTQGEFFASDHASFYMKDIPVLFFFTGTHADYHRPSDDTDKINFPGMARVADLGELLLLDLIRRPERPKFQKLGRGPILGGGASRSGSSAYLGTRPNYADSPDGGGVKLEGVNDDSPAAKGGLKGGDVIVKFGGKDVKDIDTYMNALSSHKPGETVEVVVKRDGKEETLKVTLGTRPSSGSRN